MTTKRISVLQEADKLVNGRRDVEYGLPHINWGDTVEMFTAYLHGRGLLPRDKVLDAQDGAMLMTLVKVARQANKRQRDNLVDLAGYAAVAERIEREE